MLNSFNTITNLNVCLVIHVLTFPLKDMNEVANFIRGQYLPDGKEGCYENEWNYPPYCPSMYTDLI